MFTILLLFERCHLFRFILFYIKYIYQRHLWYELFIPRLSRSLILTWFECFEGIFRRNPFRLLPFDRLGWFIGVRIIRPSGCLFQVVKDTSYPLSHLFRGRCHNYELYVRWEEQRNTARRIPIITGLLYVLCSMLPYLFYAAFPFLSVACPKNNWTSSRSELSILPTISRSGTKTRRH